MSAVYPRHVVIPLGGDDGEVTFNCQEGEFELDLDAYYTFEMEANGKLFTLMSCRTAHWDAATGYAYMQPALASFTRKEL